MEVDRGVYQISRDGGDSVIMESMVAVINTLITKGCQDSLMRVETLSYFYAEYYFSLTIVYLNYDVLQFYQAIYFSLNC